MAARRTATGKVPRRRAVTREQLIAAAEACFIESGFQGSSVEWVAAEAGYTPGAIYSSFGDKAGLFMAVLERRNRAQMERWRAAGAGPDAAHKVAEMLERQLKDPEWVRWASAYYEFYAFAVREPAVMSQFREMFQDMGRAVTDALTSLSEHSSIPSNDFVQLVRAATHGLALIALLDGSWDVSRLMTTLVDKLKEAPPPAAGEGPGEDGSAERASS